MKWIGQHIVDLIARFRGDVYLEDISTGTIASGAHLGLDSNNKIVKAVDGGGDLTSIVAGNDLGGTNLTGPTPTLNLNSTLYGVSAIHNESLVVGWGPESQVDFDTEGRIRFKLGNANQVEIIDGAILPITTNDIDLGAGDPEVHFKDLWLKGNANIEGNISGTWAGAVIPSAKLDADTAHLSVNNIFTGDNNTFSSSTASKPLLELKNTHTTTSSSAEIKFVKDAVDTEDAERLGFISFYGENESNVQTKFVQIQAQIAESDAGAEGGKIGIAVAAYDGEMQTGVLIVDGDAEDEVDVTIATGAASTTTIAGTLTMGSTAAMTNAGLLSVANQSNITGVGTLSSGNATGIVTDASTSAKGIASFSSDNFAASSGVITIKDGGVDLAVEVTGVLPTANIADDAITEDKLANTLLAEIDANTAKNTATNIHGSVIKLIPSDFVANDDGNNQKFGVGYIDDDSTASAYGMRGANSLTELLAFASIPEGMEAVSVHIYDKNDLAIEVFECTVSGTTMTSRGTGNCGTTLTLGGGTPVESSAINFLAIRVTSTNFSNDRIYGGIVTIAAI